MNAAEEEKLKEEIRTRRKIERVSRRIKEEAIKLRQQEQLEKIKVRIPKLLAERDRKVSAKRTKQFVELDVIEDCPTIDLTKDDFVNDKRADKLSLCPICEKAFAVTKIEAHAANCNEFSDTGADVMESPTHRNKRKKI